MPDALPSAPDARLKPVLDWILTEGRLEPGLGRFVDQLMKRAVAAGLPIWRFYIGLQLVHPQMLATGVLWRRDKGYEEVPRQHGILTSAVSRPSTRSASVWPARLVAVTPCPT